MDNYIKTQWIAGETSVSADNLNKIENQLELLTNETNNFSLTSPDGSKFKISVDNNGVLSATKM